MADTKDFIFRVTVTENKDVEGATNVHLDIGNQKDVTLNETVGAMVHLVMNQNKKMYENYLKDHQDLTEEQKEAERYSLIAQNLISFQIITFNVIREVFGDIDPEKLTAAEQMIREVAEQTVNKNFKSEDK